MEESQFAAPYGFDLDMMKRSMEGGQGPDAKKARWSPTSQSQGRGGDPFANYGYGPQASIQQQQSANQPSSPLYATPSLSINTGAAGNSAAGMGAMGTPSSATFQQNQAGGQASPVNGSGYGFGYNMLMPGMNMNMLNGFPYNGQMQSFSGQNFAAQRLPQLNIPVAQASYAPSLLSAALQSGMLSGGVTPSSANPNRTVYIGNLPATASVDELLNLVHFGPLEQVRVLPEKSCVFLSFLDPLTSQQFFADATIKKLNLHGQDLKVGWGKPSPVPTNVQMAVSQNAASRNVYLGGLEEGMTEEWLRDELSRFGLIDQVKIVRDKNIGFVHFLSIAVAMKVVQTLPNEPQWQGKRVNYGKDRCAYVPKSQQLAAHQAQANAAQQLLSTMTGLPSAGLPSAGLGSAGLGSGGLSPGGAFPSAQLPGSGGNSSMNSNGALNSAAILASPINGYSPFSAGLNSAGMDPNAMNLQQQAILSASAMLNGMAANMAVNQNRTVYLGNIHPETTTEDLCNAIRGGVLQSIRYMQDKHIAFVTFTDPTAAYTFFQVASYQGLTLNSRRLKIGWGKNSGPLPPQLALAVHSGATRNVYVGNIEDFEVFSEDKLRRDFGEFGDVELVNFLKEKNCAFVNFTNISNAIKAIDAIKLKPEYANLRIAHGKDRCANPPRAGTQGGGRRHNTSATHGGEGEEPMSAVEGEMVEFDEDGNPIPVSGDDHASGVPVPEGEMTVDTHA